MATRLGTVLGTTLGTDVGTFVDHAVFDATKLYALSGFTTVDRYATPNGGGEAGVATGFLDVALVRLRALPGTSQIFGARSGGASEGYFLQINSSSQMLFLAKSTGGFPSSPSYQFTASDIGKIFLIVGMVTDVSTSGLIRLWVPRAERGAGTAMVGYTAPGGTLPQTLSLLGSLVQAATHLDIIDAATFRGTPSDADVRALYDAVRTTGAIPSTMTGATLTHGWPVKSTLAALGQPVVDGQAAPASVADVVTNAAGDLMTKTGSPVVRVIDPAAPKAWSYETAPIYRGGDGWSSTAYYQSSFTDPTANNTSFWWALLAYVPTFTQAGHVLLGAANGNLGWDVRMATNNGIISWMMGDGASYSVSGNASMTLDKINLVVGVWDQANTRQRIYNKKAEVGTGTARTGYATAGIPIGFGRSARDPTLAGSNHPLLGWAMGPGAPTLAQVQQYFDDIVAGERMVAMAGMTTQVLVDYTQDSPSGALPASLANRGTLGGTFALNGTPTVANQYARNYAW